MKSKNTTGKNLTAADTWIGRTRLYSEWQHMKVEILKHKQLESEKIGHDIGWDRATLHWMLDHHRKKHIKKA